MIRSLKKIKDFFIKEKSKVFLVMWDNDMVEVTAHKTEIYWKARWVSNRDQWSLLLPKGITSGTNLVKSWKISSDPTGELEKLFKGEQNAEN